jgi:hypothetical protein
MLISSGTHYRAVLREKWLREPDTRGDGNESNRETEKSKTRLTCKHHRKYYKAPRVTSATFPKKKIAATLKHL